jgi:hypothetical protein
MQLPSMARCAAFILVQLAFGGASCSQASPDGVAPGTAAEPAESEPALEPPEAEPAIIDTSSVGSPEVENGQTGSIGARECQEDLDCFGGSLVRNLAPIGRVEPVGASCVHLYESLPVCECRMQLTRPALGDEPAASYEVQLYPGNRAGGCSEWSIEPGCLYCGSEFPGCSVDDASSCDAVCADMTARFDREIQKTIQATARVARCAPGTFHCQVVTEIDGRCYAGQPGRIDAPELDCNLSDAELLEHSADPSVPSCAAVAPVACTTADDCPRGLACNAGVCGACSDMCSYPTGQSDRAVCEGDVACAAGELCTLGRCLPSANVGCRFFSECGKNESCVLSGVSDDGRGNADTRSFCAAPR